MSRRGDVQVGTAVYEPHPLQVVRGMLDVLDSCVRYRKPTKQSEPPPPRAARMSPSKLHRLSQVSSL